MAVVWGALIAILGMAGAVLFMVLTLRARHKVSFSLLLVGMCIAAVCAYAGILWGGLLLGWLTITPEAGRLALALCLAALAWLGLLSFSPSRK